VVEPTSTETATDDGPGESPVSSIGGRRRTEQKEEGYLDGSNKGSKEGTTRQWPTQIRNPNF